MTIRSVPQCALWLCATAAAFAGCSSEGKSTLLPSPVSQSALSQSGQTSPYETMAKEEQGSRPSWIAPDASSQDLLYVTDVHAVTVYSYPSGRLEGILKGFYSPIGECVDKSGDVWIVDLGHGRVVEYAHGGMKPIATVKASGLGCAVDPTTGDLAVTTGASLSVFKPGSGQPTTYTDSAITEFWYCGFNDKGDLFADGRYESGGLFELAELPKGGATLKNIKVNQLIGWPGGVQWDGKHLAIGDSNTPVIYQFTVSGRRAQEVGATTLGRPAEYVFQFFIDGQTVIAPNEYFDGDHNLSNVLLYSYPSGGTPTRTLTKDVKFPHGVVVSHATT